MIAAGESALTAIRAFRQGQIDNLADYDERETLKCVCIALEAVELQLEEFDMLASAPDTYEPPTIQNVDPATLSPEIQTWAAITINTKGT